MKKIEKISIVTLVLLNVLIFRAYAQIVNYAGGKTVNESEYINYIGTPYITEAWNDGTVTFSNNKVVKLPLKYNGKDDEVYFKNDKGEPMSFIEPVKSFIINMNNKETLFRNGYPEGAGITHKSYLVVLVDGKTQFLEKQSKSVVETKEYTSSVTNKRFLNVTRYYIYSGDKIIQVTKDKKSIFAAIGNKQPELDEFLKTNHLNLKNDEDVSKLIIYYNSLN